MEPSLPNTNAQSPVPTNAAPQYVSPSNIKPPKNGRKSRKKLFLAIAVVVLLVGIVAGSVMWGMQQKNAADDAKTHSNSIQAENQKLSADNQKLTDELNARKVTTGEENINKERYQAVFMKNDQVYFGKITKITETQVTLEDIFYLKLATMAKTTADLPDDVELIKLGSELHGPEDVMYIERKVVQFWENLKPDGEVNKAIEEYNRQH